MVFERSCYTSQVLEHQSARRKHVHEHFLPSTFRAWSRTFQTAQRKRARLPTLHPQARAHCTHSCNKAELPMCRPCAATLHVTARASGMPVSVSVPSSVRLRAACVRGCRQRLTGRRSHTGARKQTHRRHTLAGRHLQSQADTHKRTLPSNCDAMIYSMCVPASASCDSSQPPEPGSSTLRCLNSSAQD